MRIRLKKRRYQKELQRFTSDPRTVKSRNNNLGMYGTDVYELGHEKLSVTPRLNGNVDCFLDTLEFYPGRGKDLDFGYCLAVNMVMHCLNYNELNKDDLETLINSATPEQTNRLLVELNTNLTNQFTCSKALKYILASLSHSEFIIFLIIYHKPKEYTHVPITYITDTSYSVFKYFTQTANAHLSIRRINEKFPSLITVDNTLRWPRFIVNHKMIEKLEQKSKLFSEL